MKPRFLHLAGWFAIILISLDLGFYMILPTSPHLDPFDGISCGWDARGGQGGPNLLSVRGCETFCQGLGFNYRNNSDDRTLGSPFLFSLSVLHFILTFVRNPGSLCH